MNTLLKWQEWHFAGTIGFPSLHDRTIPYIADIYWNCRDHFTLDEMLYISEFYFTAL